LFSSILPGITRDSILQLATDLGFTVHEAVIPREMLYQADEAFFVGTAVEVTPIRSVDRIQVGRGARGPVTEQIQREFFAYVAGARDDVHGWFTPVAPAKRPESSKETVRI
jgi:branched-chain amino acid aminotransferase